MGGGSWASLWRAGRAGVDDARRRRTAQRAVDGAARSREKRTCSSVTPQFPHPIPRPRHTQAGPCRARRRGRRAGLSGGVACVRAWLGAWGAWGGLVGWLPSRAAMPRVQLLSRPHPSPGSPHLTNGPSRSTPPPPPTPAIRASWARLEPPTLRLTLPFCRPVFTLSLISSCLTS